MPGQIVQPLTLKENGEKDRVASLRSLGAPHIDSFNFAMERGLQLLPEYIEPVIFRTPRDSTDKGTVEIRIQKLAIVRPRTYDGQHLNAESTLLYPKDCLLSGGTYLGDLLCTFEVTVDDEALQIPIRRIARVPIMVGSSSCNLCGMSPEQLVKHGEEEYEFGGYFIVNGAEKLIRMNLVPRVNHPISARRPANSSRGAQFTEMSLSVRCQRADLSTGTIHMHLLKSGGISVRFLCKMNEYFVPAGLLLRALLPAETSYREIFELIVGGDSDNSMLKECALAVIVDMRDQVSHLRKEDCESGVRVSVSRTAAIAFLGRSFRVHLNLDEELFTDLEAGVIFLRRFIFIHLSVSAFESVSERLDYAKAEFLTHLIRKLVATASGEIEVDNPDALSHLQVLLPGNLYLSVLKDRLQSFLTTVSAIVKQVVNKKVEQDNYSRQQLPNIVSSSFQRAMNRPLVGERLVYLLATGNLSCDDNMDLPQTVGYSIVAERINYLRFISHFRSVHRGAFYAQMRSTKVRKLLPEAWGFICPVHTPDGDPCGILNHLASQVSVSQGFSANAQAVLDLLSEFGVIPACSIAGTFPTRPPQSFPIVLDGRVIGFTTKEKAASVADQLRLAKLASQVDALPETSEIVHVPLAYKGRGFYRGIYIFTSGGRLLRPVHWLQRKAKKSKKASSEVNGPNGVEPARDRNGTTEQIGTFEQVFMRIRLAKADQEDSLVPVYSSNATHAEISATSFLSEVASLSPFPDMNQGPRNMFQCQMAKQAMGTPCHVFSKRTDPKSYRLTSPQVPITRNYCMQDPLGADLFGNGVNAIVAVISYTGNDMEDALIMNQGSLNRGFAHGTVYVTKRVDLDVSISGRESKFYPVTSNQSGSETIEEDGLPAVGARLETGDKLYGICGRLLSADDALGNQTEDVKWTQHKSVETHTVDSVILSDTTTHVLKNKKTTGIRYATIRTRVSRTPNVGDKFASRAGQKGTVAAAWPMEDMPFSETGMVPDILFNPNGFPSRMTIGMMVESMAGKAGALHGVFQDSTPFRFDEKNRAVDHFADQLHKAGYSYHGSETLYSGYSGEPFEVDIFMGLVHYQRLRHMVSDKFQVRSTGKVHPLFRQPVKGRKRGGAIRFGEMERDGVLAHGAAGVLRERLGSASDMHVVHVCGICGSIVTAIVATESTDILPEGEVYCLQCGADKAEEVRKVALPYSFKYLLNELVAMNIRTVLTLKPI